MTITESRKTESFFRGMAADRCGGREFDKPGGGYAFSSVLAEERALAKSNRVGDPASALLALSVADPTWRMNQEAMQLGIEYYNICADATRYTDLNGASLVPSNTGGLVEGSTNRFIADWVSAMHDHTSFVDSEWVQYSPGAIKRALAEYIPTAFIDHDTYVMAPDLGYPVMTSPMNMSGKHIQLPVECNDGDWELFPRVLMSSSLRLPRCSKIVLYVNIPHNPTGKAYCRKEWEWLLGWACNIGALLVVDEAYIELAYDGRYCSVLDVPGWEESCIVLRSVSKGWNATGLRFGYIVAHPTAIKALRKVMDVKDSGLFGPSILSGLSCISRHWMTAGTRERYRHLHKELLLGLHKAGFNARMPDAGLCQLTPAPESANGITFGDAAECAQWLRENLRVSVMHYTISGQPWLRWAVTVRSIPECGLEDESSVIAEVARRLGEVKFVF